METKKVWLRLLRKDGVKISLSWSKSESTNEPGYYDKDWHIYIGEKYSNNNSFDEVLFRFMRHIISHVSISKHRAYIVEESNGNCIHFFNFDEALQAFLNRTVGR